MVTKKQENKLIKEDDKKAKISEVTKWLTEGFDFSDTSKMEKELSDLEEIKQLTPKEKQRKIELEVEIGMIHGLENGAWAGNISYVKNFKTLTTLRSSFVKEYDCKTPIELLLIDRIVASYWRSMQCDMVFNRMMINEEDKIHFDQLKVNVLKELNKSIDCANRQLNTNIILLKEIKQPNLDVKVNTKTAFIGNQQFNVNKPNEIIEPK